MILFEWVEKHFALSRHDMDTLFSCLDHSHVTLRRRFRGNSHLLCQLKQQQTFPGYFRPWSLLSMPRLLLNIPKSWPFPQRFRESTVKRHTNILDWELARTPLVALDNARLIYTNTNEFGHMRRGLLTMYKTATYFFCLAESAAAQRSNVYALTFTHMSHLALGII